jgi:hypothetical protein
MGDDRLNNIDPSAHGSWPRYTMPKHDNVHWIQGVT